MKTFVALFLTAAALAAAPLTRASAHEAAAATVAVPVAGTTAVLPATVHLNETVIIEHRHHYHRHYYRHHYYHHRHYYYRHGVRRYY